MPPIDRVVTHGTFELDGGPWEVDNNIWLVGDDTDVVVIDAAHNAAPIVDAVAGRNAVAVVCTHGHNDHITVAPQLGNELDAPVPQHPADEMLWRMTHPDKDFRVLDADSVLNIGGVELRAIHTPGHSPGSTCLHAPELDAVFSETAGVLRRRGADTCTRACGVSGRRRCSGSHRECFCRTACPDSRR